MSPSAVFKSFALGNLPTHLPQLNEFLKKLVEDYGSAFAAVFFKKIKSNEIMTVDNYCPASAKFDFKPQLVDAILESQESTTLLSSCAEYVETCQRKLGNFAIQAFQMNKKQLIIRLDKLLSALLHACEVFDREAGHHGLPSARHSHEPVLPPPGGTRGAKQHDAFPPSQKLQRGAQARATAIPHPAQP